MRVLRKVVATARSAACHCFYVRHRVTSRFFDERRKDYFVMYAHHVITIALVGALELC